MLFCEYLEREAHTLDVESAKEFFRWLVAYVDEPRTIKILRQYGGYNRACLYTGQDGTRFVFGDNEPAVWCFTALYDGEDLAGQLSTGLLLERICICDRRGRGESDGQRPWCFRQRAKTWNASGGVDHKHIFDVKERSISFPPEEVTAGPARAQMIRYLAPMNHFLMPRHCTNAAERNSPYQAVAAWFMLLRYGDDYVEFLRRAWVAGAEEVLALGESQARVLKLPEPVRAAPAIDRREDREGGGELLRKLSPGEFARYRMTIGGDGRNFSTRAIGLACLEEPYTLDVSHMDEAEPVGRFALDLGGMLRAGVVRIERQRNKGEFVRLTVKKQGPDYFVQLNESSPCVRLPRR